MRLFEPPPPTKWNVLNLGAGVQSSCLALMAAKGEIGPMPNFAIFADTMAEPDSVYRWLDWLEKQLPFPVYRVTKGSLTADQITVSTRKKDTDNAKAGTTYIKSIIPMFGKMPSGEVVAAIGRKCTSDYKIAPIQKEIKKICGVARGQKEPTITQWVGISWDEIQRMKTSREPWTQLRYPLIENRINRQMCLEWMRVNGYPEPPRSACVYCPFHSDSEWRRLRDNEPDAFKKAIVFDSLLRRAYKQSDKTTKMEVYLHRSCKPLGEIDFDSDEQKGQQVWDFQSECEGMCGV